MDVISTRRRLGIRAFIITSIMIVPGSLLVKLNPFGGTERPSQSLALIRLSDSMPFDLKMRRMQEIVDILELNKCLDTKMGNGLSGGERKRASIACELIGNPELLLIDEPTTGLDSATAWSLMSSMERYAKESMKTILITIHQPSSEIFHMINKVLLLTEGQVAYFGPVSQILDFFGSLGLHCDRNYNPADFILKQVKSTSKERILESFRTRKNSEMESMLSRDPVDYSRDESSCHNSDNEISHSDFNENKSSSLDISRLADLESDLDRCRSACNGVNVDVYKDKRAQWQTGFMTQYQALTKRAFIQSKSRFLSPFMLCQLAVIIFTGLEWLQLQRTEETLNDRFGVIYVLIFNQGFPAVLDAVPRMIDDFGVFNRERESGIYRLSAYCLAIMTSEIPCTFVMTSINCLVVYWMTNLTRTTVNFFMFWAIYVLAAFVAQSFGFFIGALIEDRNFSIPIATTGMVVFILLGGFYNTHVVAWFSWMRYLSIITYSAAALSKVEFIYGDPFQCKPPSSTSFPLSCGNGTTLSGEEFLSNKLLDFFPLYGDIAALIAFGIIFRLATYFSILLYGRKSLR